MPLVVAVFQHLAERRFQVAGELGVIAEGRAADAVADLDEVKKGLAVPVPEVRIVKAHGMSGSYRGGPL